MCAARASGVQTWSCASNTSWPCPDGAGCRSVTGAGGRGGAGGAGGAGGSAVLACPSTVAKGGACTPTDIQFCYKTCGPEKTGLKSETCTTGGVYAEMSGCTFDPSLDYSCYALSDQASSLCPAAVTPQASATCDVPTCMSCNSSQGAPGGLYLDAAGAQRVGYCVCQATNSAGLRTWSCASDTQWPCPLGAGCDGTGRGGSGGASGTAGASGTGRGGSGGASGTGGGPGPFGQPACPSTVAKGGACASTDVQFCYKICGPEKSGVKSETCQTSGTYAEMSGCAFDPSVDYSCYKIPTTANSVCAAGVTPMAAAPCDVPACTLCNSTQGLVGGVYFDSAGATHVGYCVCQASGARVWSCASDVAWPCPAGSGC